MSLSDEKTTHLTHILLKGLLDQGVITPLVEDGDIRREMKRVISKELKINADIDISVRNKLNSYSKKIPEGSPEWEVLYQKFFHEEASKKGRA
ncbi:MAG: DUF507 family protein [Nitrospiraceae bacterium]|nr:MAG: DUF507 family protein [bacterium]UCF87704.1 MAG: DUF507 family protein [Nitrospiraceae bacterium]